MSKLNKTKWGLRFKKIFLLLIRILSIVICLLVVYLAATYILIYKLKLFNESIAVSGTGSMYPTFPRGQNKNPKEQAKEIVSTPGMLPFPSGIFILGKNYFGHQIQRGDIITFSNKKTQEITLKNYNESSGLIKRVVALEGDTVEIRNGIFYLNNKPQKEAYTALPHSTFGGPFLSDCQKLKIPSGKLLVMGDNRKGSGDSRHDLGPIEIKDIDHVLPYQKQIGVFSKNWRDTTNDLEENSKIKIDKLQYLKLLNQKRQEAGLKPLTYQIKLEQSAFKRGGTILKYDDFSFEATKSGYTQKKAMQDVGYSNIIWGEAPLSGYYQADELIENLFEQPDWKKFLLDRDTQEFGIAEVEGQINGCPTQVIVQHFAGYIAPNYKATDIISWKKVISSLEEIQPGWSKLKEDSDFYNKNKIDVDLINELINLRLTNAKQIVKKMELNLWLNSEEEKYADADEKLFNQIDDLANKLNNRSN